MLGSPTMTPPTVPAMIAPARIEPAARVGAVAIAAPCHRAAGRASTGVVNALFSSLVRQTATGSWLEPTRSPATPAKGPTLQPHVHVHDRAAFAEATALIARFGELAASEAAQRAEHSRGVGNVVNFCRWRQIERTIHMLCADAVTGTVH